MRWVKVKGVQVEETTEKHYSSLQLPASFVEWFRLIYIFELVSQLQL